MGLRSRVEDTCAQLLRGFFRRNLQLFFIMAVEPVLMRLAHATQRLARRRVHPWMLLRARREFQKCKAGKNEILAAARRRPTTCVADLGLQPDQLRRLQARLDRGEEVVIAEVDRDFFFLSHFGPLPGLPTVEAAEFVSRRAYRVQLVARSGWVGVKKWHRKKRFVVQRFLSEIHALDTLGRAGCRVPAILDIDFDELTLTTAFIRGDNLRERLARASAVVRDRDVENDAGLRRMPPAEQWKRRVQNGARVVDRVVTGRFVEDLQRQLRIIHASRITWNDLKYGNIIIDEKSGLPWLIDFDGSTDCRRTNRYSFRVLCDADWEWFNRQFNRRRWTYRRIKQHAGARGDNPLKHRFYAPAYLGYGLRFGRIWRIGGGFGRWNYILRDNLPPVSGKRVLVLGANNGFNAIQLARNGAREVIAVERDEPCIRQGELLRELYEWADSRPLNVRFVRADMRALDELELGTFDVALALACLYYLDRPDMHRLTRHVAAISEVFVLQGNHATGIGRPSQEIYEKARVEFLEQVLQRNGFAATSAVMFPCYCYPLVIGRKAVTSPATRGPHIKLGSRAAGREVRPVAETPHG